MLGTQNIEYRNAGEKKIPHKISDVTIDDVMI